MIKKSRVMFVISSFLLLSLASAETVQPGETIDLLQLTSSMALDTSGTERTYLYCTWQIDSMGEEVVEMTTQNCPEIEQEFTFEDDETYHRRIDFANIIWDVENSEWDVISTGQSDEATTHYELDLPEPEESFLNGIVDTLRNSVRAVLCTLFPGSGFCD